MLERAEEMLPSEETPGLGAGRMETVPLPALAT